MILKTSELDGFLLDAAVVSARNAGRPSPYRYGPNYSPSRKWEHGGVIIQTERIAITPSNRSGPTQWSAEVWDARPPVRSMGPTALIAAMRAYVASKLGEEVELP